VRFREASASELLMRSRNEEDNIRTGVLTRPRDKSERNLFTAWHYYKNLIATWFNEIEEYPREGSESITGQSIFALCV
jgi:hypothetical protein